MALFNESVKEACAKLLPPAYVDQAKNATNSTYNHIQELLEKRKLPEEGWPDDRTERLLNDLADMDSNNFPSNAGVGEREGRVFSSLVSRRHYRLAHGIGRSGDITAVQPKAAGSSLVNILSNRLVLDTIKISGAQKCQSCFIVPMATGMALTLCLLYFKRKRSQAKYVIWPRIDQKSCFKSIATSGCLAVVIENILEGDQLITDINSIQDKITELGVQNIVCVMTTTSCFAPRSIDNVEDVSRICDRYDIPHLINNAYGVQSTKCMHVIQQAERVGRVDVFVQSTDKNYLVPVGGSIIAGFDKLTIEDISKSYPGRASASPSIDVLITLLSLGASGWRSFIKQQKVNYQSLKKQVTAVVEKYGERVLETHGNPISLGITLDNVGMKRDDLTEVGSMMFHRNISGMRVVTGLDKKEINGHTFTGFGAHHSNYRHPYFTVAAGIGMTNDDITTFCQRLDKVFKKLKTSNSNPEGSGEQVAA